MASVQPRQVAVLSVANYGELCDTCGKDAADQLVQTLREFAWSVGVERDHMRMFNLNTILMRLDRLPREEFLHAVQRLAEFARTKATQLTPPVPAHVLVGAISERAQRSFVNDMAMAMLAHMEHTGNRAVFLIGDERDPWPTEEAPSIDFVTFTQLMSADQFTGMLEQKHFVSVLQEELDKPTRADEPGYVVYFNVEDFKSYNRTFGRPAGDDLVRYVARQIEAEFPADLAAHLSIDRFAVLTHRHDAVRRCINLHDFVHRYCDEVAVELKSGVVACGPSITDANDALDRAKLACETIKGRFDSVCKTYDDKLEKRLNMAHYVVGNVDKALAQGWIKPYYQPVIDAATGELSGYEALCRWEDPDLGLMSPGVFIPVLEEAHLIHKVDTFMVRSVCKRMGSARDKGEEVVPMSINLSRLDFQLCDVFAIVEEAVERNGVPRDLLAIEVTESVLDSNREYFRMQMSRFRDAGFEVWMDDFGSGYSSLGLLKDYEFDVIKVDMEFLRGMEGNRRSREIVTAVVQMAHRLDMRALVEGVESMVQLQFLRDIGCDLLQGYLFGKPMPMGD